MNQTDRSITKKFSIDDMVGSKIEHSRYRIISKKSIRRILLQNLTYFATIDEQEKLSVKHQHSIVIEDGIITNILSPTQLRKFNISNIDLIYDGGVRDGLLVTPGFINGHAHPPMYLLRAVFAYAEDNLARTLKLMAALEGNMTKKDYVLGAIGDFTEEQAYGITSVLSHYGVFEPIDEAARVTRQRVINALSAISNSHPENSPQTIINLLKQKKNFSSQVAIALHYVHKAEPADLELLARIMKDHKVLLTLHVAETKFDVQACVDKYGLRPVEVLAKYGLLGSHTVMSHCVHLTNREIKLIKKYGATIVHLPSSNLLHRSGRFNYPLLHQLGADSHIMLGTDSVVSKSRLDVLSEAYQAKMMHQESQVLSYGELFNMITAQGARLLGLPQVGKILPGYKADLAFWKLKERGLIPFDPTHPESIVVNLLGNGGRRVRDLMIDGKFVISNRLYNYVDESALLKKLQAVHTRMQKARAEI